MLSMIDYLRNLTMKTWLDGFVLCMDIIRDPNNGIMSDPLFDTTIPFIGASVRDAVDIIGDMAHLAQDIDRHPAASLQAFTQQIRGALGLPAESDMVKLRFTGSDDGRTLESIVLSFDYQIGATSSSSLYFDMAQLVSKATSKRFICIIISYCAMVIMLLISHVSVIIIIKIK